MSIQPVHVAGDGLIWSCEFYNSLCVTDQGGVVIAGAPIIDEGVTTSGVNTDHIRFTGNVNSATCGANRATWMMDLITPSNIVNASLIYGRYGDVGSRAWEFDIESEYLFAFITNVGAGNTSTDRSTAKILASTPYHVTWVYNGTTIVLYLNGVPTASSHTLGTLPANLERVSTPLNVFAENAAKLSRPGLTIKSLHIFDFAMSAAEVADWYARLTNRELTP